jgi:hypothetical protein
MQIWRDCDNHNQVILYIQMINKTMEILEQ